MNNLLLAPYDDSMRLGHRYNSFLNTPCVDKAVHITPTDVTSLAATPQPSVPQIVSYNSRYVKDLSDLVESMNISPASAIQLGSLKLLGNFTPINETAFKESSLNIVVSVSVMNQNTKLQESVTFLPPADGLLPITTPSTASLRFVQLYGDSYISGFVEGGEFLAIVSVKVLDDSKKDSILNTLKGKINSASSDSPLGNKPGDFSSILEHTETTITVNWSGGGQVKPPNQEWSLNNLFQVAAEFPAKVAECATRTWAILTRYDKNQSFAEWAHKSNVVLPQFDSLHRYTSNLLHMYLDYKSHIAFLQDVVSRPVDYKQSTSSEAVVITLEGLLHARTQIKAEMEKIVDEVDLLCRNPECDKSSITIPELWAARLPVLQNTTSPSHIIPLTGITPQGGPTVPRGAPRTGMFELRGNHFATVGYGSGFDATRNDLLVGMTYLALQITPDLKLRIVCAVEKRQYLFGLDVDNHSSHEATCSFLNPALCGPGFQSGNMMPQTRTTINHIRFRERFAKIPQAVVWISGLEVRTNYECKVKVCATRVTTSGFTVEADGWTRCQSIHKQVAWVAFPESPSIQSGIVIFGKGHPHDSDVSFPNESEVFMAVNTFQSRNTKPDFHVTPKFCGDDEWCITCAEAESDGNTADESDGNTVGVSYIMFSAIDV